MNSTYLRYRFASDNTFKFCSVIFINCSISKKLLQSWCYRFFLCFNYFTLNLRWANCFNNEIGKTLCFTTWVMGFHCIHAFVVRWHFQNSKADISFFIMVQLKLKSMHTNKSNYFKLNKIEVFTWCHCSDCGLLGCDTVWSPLHEGKELEGSLQGESSYFCLKQHTSTWALENG